ncbi:MAG: hypothetical protein IKA18_01050 [Clostridia bacterium]|nr:hypothetical protein [Clostridia bacterium]
MNNVSQLIEKRRSVRTYLEKEIKSDDLSALNNYLSTISNPFNAPVEFKFLDANTHGLKCPVITGTNTFLAGKIKRFDGFEIAFGYSFEKAILYATSLNLGTVWLGGTFNRSAFEKAMELKEDEAMPCATPLGYISEKMSVKEKLMRSAIKADSRLPFEKLAVTTGINPTPIDIVNVGIKLKSVYAFPLIP